MYGRLGSFVSRYWWLVILVWVGAAIAIQSVAPNWDEITQDGDLAYLPAELTSVKGEKLFGEAFPDNKSKSQVVVVLERETGLLEADLKLAQEFADYYESQRTEYDRLLASDPDGAWKRDKNGPLHVIEVVRPLSDFSGDVTPENVIGEKLVSSDQKAAIVVCSLADEFIALDSISAVRKTREMVAEKLSAAQSREANALPAGLKTGITGSAAVGGETLVASNESIQNIHVATAILVILILLAVYRAPVLVFVPIITIGMAVWIAKNLVGLMTQLHLVPGFDWFHFEIFKTSEIFIFTILFGSGTDFCLFLISRYKEEMERGHDKASALKESLGQVGEALTGSAFTTICGLSAMFFADFGKFKYSGPSIALCLFIALLACLTFAPALLRGCGRMVFWPFGLKVRMQTQDSHEESAPDTSLIGRFWHWTSDHIMARPGLLLIVSLIVMTPLAIAGWEVKISYDLMADLPTEAPCRHGTKMFTSHFPAGEVGPITMLVRKPDANFNDDKARRNHVAALTKDLYSRFENDVEEIRSVEYPLGWQGKKHWPTSEEGRKELIAKNSERAKRTYVANTGELQGTVTRFDILTKHDPFSTEAMTVLSNIEDYVKGNKGKHEAGDAATRIIGLTEIQDEANPWQNAQIEFIGTTAGTRDLKATITSDEWVIQCLTVMLVLGVILWILRRPVVCLYLIFTVVFSYLVTIGATELVFNWIYGSAYTGLDWKVPIFLFVILVAVGEDYNIYLATRVFEEERRLGRERGLREAIIKTGGIITSCGVIMAGTFVSLMSGTLKAMHALGFALTLGVILDTFIVRPVLVPAFLAFLYKVFPERKGKHATLVAESEAVIGASGAAAATVESASVPAKPHTEMARRSVKSEFTSG